MQLARKMESFMSETMPLPWKEFRRMSEGLEISKQKADCFGGITLDFWWHLHNATAFHNDLLSEEATAEDPIILCF